MVHDGIARSFVERTTIKTIANERKGSTIPMAHGLGEIRRSACQINDHAVGIVAAQISSIARRIPMDNSFRCPVFAAPALRRGDVIRAIACSLTKTNGTDVTKRRSGPDGVGTVIRNAFENNATPSIAGVARSIQNSVRRIASTVGSTIASLNHKEVVRTVGREGCDACYEVNPNSGIRPSWLSSLAARLTWPYPRRDDMQEVSYAA